MAEATIKELVRINFKKGDILTVKLEGDTSDYMKDVIEVEFEDFIKSLELNFDVPVIVIEDNIKIEISN